MKTKITSTAINHKIYIGLIFSDHYIHYKVGKGKTQMWNYVHPAVSVYAHTRHSGPWSGNQNSTEVSVPPVPRCLALGLWMLPANSKSLSWLHPPRNAGSITVFTNSNKQKSLQDQILVTGNSTVCFLWKTDSKSVRKNYLWARKDTMSKNSGILNLIQSCHHSPKPQRHFELTQTTNPYCFEVI